MNGVGVVVEFTVKNGRWAMDVVWLGGRGFRRGGCDVCDAKFFKGN